MNEKYTLEEIEEAWRKSGRCWEKMQDQLTRPKPEFAEGQVVVFSREKTVQYDLAETFEDEIKHYCRPLTQTEVGPNWVPAEAVKVLRDVASRVYDHLDNGGKLDSQTLLYSILRDTLNEFDASIALEES